MNYKKIAAFLSAAAISVCLLISCNKSTAKKGEMRDISSETLVSEMTLGWNLGDTLDVCAADRDGDGKINEAPAEGEEVDETLWGNPKANKKVFEKIKDDGFNSVRIRITWRDHLGKAPDYIISDNWMNRVEEVVNYAYSLDMYVIINVHHDGGGDPDFGAWIRNASYDYDGVIEKYKALWNQIADRFEDYSDRLIFASMNEVGFDDLRGPENYEVLNKINQEFVNLIRSSGGNNPKRHLLIAGYYTDITMTCSSNFKMPDDPENRCILSLHYYTPWQFCTTTQQRNWGTEAEVEEMKRLITNMTDKFTDNGIPVIIGEYGTARGNDEPSRVYFSETFVKLCHENNIPAFLWDNGSELDRGSLKWQNPELPKALNRAVSDKNYTPAKYD